MDPNRFDTLARSLTDARSRRAALASLLGGTLGLLGLAETSAKNRTGNDVHGEGKKKKKKKKKKKAPVPTTQTPVESSSPVSPPPPAVCTPSCPNNQTCQTGTCVCPGGGRPCTLDGSCGECCLHADCCNGAFPCPAGSQICRPPVNGNRVCGCPDGTELCSGTCRAVCNALQFRDPTTCGCCGIYCFSDDDCCSRECGAGFLCVR